MYTSVIMLAFLSALCSTTLTRPSPMSGPAPRKLTTVDIQIAPSGPQRFKKGSATNVFATERMSYFVADGLAITHGDIIYGIEDDVIQNVSAHKRSLSRFKWDNQSLWSAGRIKYKWQSRDAKGLGRLEAWKEATKRWKNMLPFLQFVEHPADDTLVNDIVTLVPTEGQYACFSPIGKAQNAKANRIMLDDQCGGAGTYTHELGHTLGLYHEHMRPDRDDYITINCDNVLQTDDSPPDCSQNCEGYGCNFVKLAKNAADWSGPYNSLSIMHYSPNEFANNNGPAIETKPGVPSPRPHTFPTAQDAKRICDLYREQCTGVCGNGVLEPKNGEECDDGNNVDGDGCSANCKREGRMV